MDLHSSKSKSVKFCENLISSSINHKTIQRFRWTFFPAEFTMSSLACSGLLPAPQHRAPTTHQRQKKKLDGFSASGMHKFQCGAMLAGLTKPPQQLLSKALFYVAAVHFPRVSGMPFFIIAAINQFSSPCHWCHFTSLSSRWFPPSPRHTHPPNRLQLPFSCATETASLRAWHTHSLTHTSITTSLLKKKKHLSINCNVKYKAADMKWVSEMSWHKVVMMRS